MQILEIWTSAPIPLDFEEHESRIKRLQAETKRLTKELLIPLNDEMLRETEALIAKKLLLFAIEYAEKVPKFNQLERDRFSKESLGLGERHSETMLRIIVILDEAAGELGSRGKIIVRLRDNLDHDCRGHLCYARDVLSFHYHTSRVLEQKDLIDFKFALGSLRSYVLQVLRANLHIGEGIFPFSAIDPKSEFESVLEVNWRRFGLRPLKSDGISEAFLQPGTLTMDVNDNMTVYGEENSLALLLYNLIKNPLKIAKMNRQKVSVVVNIETTPDKLCSAIYVRDSGIGISFDKMQDHFTKQALEKQHRGDSLDFVERCLVDEAWRDHIPFVALAQKLMARGESLSGGTGIGLSLAKAIVDGHHGALRIYKHPKYGAGVQILLPNTGSNDVELRKSMVQRALVKQLTSSISS